MSRPGPGLPEAAYGAALASLPGMGPRRLAYVLRSGTPAEIWDAVCRRGLMAGDERSSGERRSTPDLLLSWQRRALVTDVAASWNALAGAGVRVDVLGQPNYPPVLARDHQAPAVLFSRGDMCGLDRRRVAIVGTRRCTSYGRDVARELGKDLAGAGVAVVSGLALGIDGAAHAGALASSRGSAVAVVGSGLDVIYPRDNAGLWERVATEGLLLSEAPLGAAPEAWRFPVRNRVIAALAEVMVVVESHARGGSRHSVEASACRGTTVMAVPGSIRSSASEFTNSLLAEGCAPVRDATDVLVALGLTSFPSACSAPPKMECRPFPQPRDLAVLDALGWEPATLEQALDRTGESLAGVGASLAHLERDGWVTCQSGWWSRVGAP